MQKSPWGNRRICDLFVHHWNTGGSVDPPWFRSLTSKTIKKLGTGKKYTLDARFNDAEIPHGVREEDVTC